MFGTHLTPSMAIVSGRIIVIRSLLNPLDKIFFRILLNIDQADYTIHSWEMYDRGGNVFSYTISGFNPQFTANDAFFEFDESKFPDVEVVDLR